MTNGRIKGVDVLSVAARLAGFPVPAAAGAAGRGSGETTFSDLSADFRVGGGKIRSDSVRIASEKMGLSGAVVIGFDKTLDFRGTLRLPKGTSDRVRRGAGKFLVGPSGQVEIPVVMSGPLGSPAVAVDTDALARGAAGNLVRGLAGKLSGAPSAADNAAPEGSGKKGKAPAPEVEELLRKLLPGR